MGWKEVDDSDDWEVYWTLSPPPSHHQPLTTTLSPPPSHHHTLTAVRIVQRNMGWKEVDDNDDWEVYWTDTSVSMERIIKLNKVQKINHFNGMLELCRKRLMAKNLLKMWKLYPQHYGFFPRTYVLPNDHNDFLADVRARGKKQFYILKPDAGCQGRGIRLVQGGKEEKIQKVLSEMDGNTVAQHYLHKPHLIHGYKYDMRIYTLVLSCDPLRVFVYKEGLTRICTEKYCAPKSSNISVSYMHLTNYAVNKHNDNFVANEGNEDSIDEAASKWSLAQTGEYIKACGHDWDAVWLSIQEVIMKSIISVQPALKNNYRSALPPDNDGFSCFELLGYDIMLDSELRPWLIEVNHSASFNIESPLDLAIKSELVFDTLTLVRVDPKLIQKVRKAEKKSAAARILGLRIDKKPSPSTAGPNPSAGPSQPPASSIATDDRDSSGSAAVQGEGGPSAGGAAPNGGGTGGPSMGPDWKPKTVEEYEIWRAEVLRVREKYEAKHSGGYTRIYPSSNPLLQATYEELLKGANDIYSAAFSSRPKKAPVVPEEQEPEIIKQGRAHVKAHRDRLAQQHAERQKMKEMAKEASMPSGAVVGPYYSYGGVYSAGGTYGVVQPQTHSGPFGAQAVNGPLQGFGNGNGAHTPYNTPRNRNEACDNESVVPHGSEIWGESDASSDFSETWSCSSRPQSACGNLPAPPQMLPTEGSMLQRYMYEGHSSSHHSINGSGQIHSPQAGAAGSTSASAALSGSTTPHSQFGYSTVSNRREGAAKGGLASPGYSKINMGVLPPSPFRGVLYPAPGQRGTPPNTPRRGCEHVGQQQAAAAAASTGLGADLTPRLSLSQTQRQPLQPLNITVPEPGPYAAALQPLLPTSGSEGLAPVNTDLPSFPKGSPWPRACWPETRLPAHRDPGEPGGELGQGWKGQCDAVPVSPGNSWSRFIQPPSVPQGSEYGGNNSAGTRAPTSASPQGARLTDKLLKQLTPRRTELTDPQIVGSLVTPAATLPQQPAKHEHHPQQGAIVQSTSSPQPTAGGSLHQHGGVANIPHATSCGRATAADATATTVPAAVPEVGRNTPSPANVEQVIPDPTAVIFHELQITPFAGRPGQGRESQVSSPSLTKHSSIAAFPPVPSQDPSRKGLRNRISGASYSPDGLASSIDYPAGLLIIAGGRGASSTTTTKRPPPSPPVGALSVGPLASGTRRVASAASHSHRRGSPTPCLKGSSLKSLSAGGWKHSTEAKEDSSEMRLASSASYTHGRGSPTASSSAHSSTGAPWQAASSLQKCSSPGGGRKVSNEAEEDSSDSDHSAELAGLGSSNQVALGSSNQPRTASSPSPTHGRPVQHPFIRAGTPSPGVSHPTGSTAPPGFFVRALTIPSAGAGGKAASSTSKTAAGPVRNRSAGVLYSAVHLTASVATRAWDNPGGANSALSTVGSARNSASARRRAAVLHASKRTAQPLQTQIYLSVSPMKVAQKDGK